MKKILVILAIILISLLVSNMAGAQSKIEFDEIIYNPSYSNLSESSVCSKTREKIEGIELILLYSFPKESDEVLLGRPTKMSFDEHGNIFINDYHLSSILKYTRQGELITTIGRSGKGPGEFTNQSKFSYDDGKLYVVDQSNRRLQILNQDGKYLSAFITPQIPSAITIFKNQIFTNLLMRANTPESKLITVFDMDGKVIKKFGEYLRFVKNFPFVGSTCILKIYDSQLYVLFRYYPILRIYSLDGQLKQHIELKKNDYAKLVPGNYKWENFTKKNQMAFSFRFLFQAFDVNENGIFIGLYNEDIIIDHYNFKAEFIQRFKRIHKEEKYYLFDFKVTQENNSTFKFFILNREGIPKMDVCSGKPKGK